MVESYAAANTALKAQVEALESSGASAGSASAEARQTAYELSNAAVSGSNVLGQLGNATDAADRKIERLEQRVATLEAELQKTIADARAGFATQRDLMQQAVNRALQEAATAEARAVKAEAAAAEALRNSEEAQLITDRNGALDAGKVEAIVRAEIQASAPGAVELAVEQIRRDKFPNGFMAPRVDGDRTRQLRSDATRMIEEQQEGR